MRTIKPGFFGNEDLIEMDPLACLLFAGLWCWADREGRLEDRPKRLKLEILPGRACDVDALLEQLADRGFIERYAVGERRYIQVVRFAHHQNPHKFERPSRIPAPGQNGACTVLAPDEHPASHAGHGVWGVGGGSWGAGHGESPPADKEEGVHEGGSGGDGAAGAAVHPGPDEVWDEVPKPRRRASPRRDRVDHFVPGAWDRPPTLPARSEAR